MATLFFDQDETRALYPEATTNEEFVTAVYNNVLGRNSDMPGLAFWLGELDEGRLSREKFIVEFLGGVPEGSDDAEYLSNKVDIAAYFSVIKGISDGQDAGAVMDLYDGSQDSINDAVAAVDGFYADALDPNNGEFLMQVVGVLDNPFEIA
jgi:hypothetical protein